MMDSGVCLLSKKGSTSTSDASTVGIVAAADFANSDRYDNDNDVRHTPRRRSYQKLY